MNMFDLGRDFIRLLEENVELKADIKGLVDERQHVAALQELNDNQATTITKLLDKVRVHKMKMAEVINEFSCRLLDLA